jgi:rod shape-determining protein MreC
MFSKKMLIFVVMVLIFFISMTILSVTSKRGMTAPAGVGRTMIPLVAPFQKATSRFMQFVRGIWEDYFYLVNVSRENRQLKKDVNLLKAQINQDREMELFNTRLREFLKYKNQTNSDVLAARVISKDSSSWFKTILIDKGTDDGLKTGLPVVVPQGVAGQIISVAKKYSKVLLIIDRNSAVDGIVQRTRARGIVKGETDDICSFHYALRKEDIKPEDVIVSSGLDGVYPKGLLIGHVVYVDKDNPGVFQDIKVIPYVDFEKLEEVLVVLNAKEDSF